MIERRMNSSRGDVAKNGCVGSVEHVCHANPMMLACFLRSCGNGPLLADRAGFVLVPKGLTRQI